MKREDIYNDIYSKLLVELEANHKEAKLNINPIYRDHEFEGDLLDFEKDKINSLYLRCLLSLVMKRL